MKLPRQTYKTDADARAEDEIAAFVATAWRAHELKIGSDPVEQMKSKVDRLLYSRHRQVVRCFFEAKDYHFRFGKWRQFGVSRKKIQNLRCLSHIVALPVVFVGRFECGTVGYFNVMRQFRPGFIGRHDRNDGADHERAALYDWSVFEFIHPPT